MQTHIHASLPIHLRLACPITSNYFSSKVVLTLQKLWKRFGLSPSDSGTATAQRKWERRAARWPFPKYPPTTNTSNSSIRPPSNINMYNIIAQKIAYWKCKNKVFKKQSDKYMTRAKMISFRAMFKVMQKHMTVDHKKYIIVYKS